MPNRIFRVPPPRYYVRKDSSQLSQEECDKDVTCLRNQHSSIRPVLYIEELDDRLTLGRDWRMFVYYVGNDEYEVLSCRADNDNKKYPMHRMRFLTRKAVFKYLQNTLDIIHSRFNFTFSMLDTSQLITDDFAGYSSLQAVSEYRELIGFDNVRFKDVYVKDWILIMRDMR